LQLRIYYFSDHKTLSKCSRLRECRNSTQSGYKRQFQNFGKASTGFRRNKFKIRKQFSINKYLICFIALNFDCKHKKTPKFGKSLLQVHASATEMFLLENKHLGDDKVIQGAMDALDRELKPDVSFLEAAPEYRKNLAKSLLYKVITISTQANHIPTLPQKITYSSNLTFKSQAMMGLMKDKVSTTLKSGADEIERHMSKGIQSYDVEKDAKSLYKAVPKIESYAQASGAYIKVQPTTTTRKYLSICTNILLLH